MTFFFKFSLLNMLNSIVLFYVEISVILNFRGPVSKNWVSRYEHENDENVSLLVVKNFAYLVWSKSFSFFLNEKKTKKIHFPGISNNRLQIFSSTFFFGLEYQGISLQVPPLLFRWLDWCLHFDWSHFFLSANGSFLFSN